MSLMRRSLFYTTLCLTIVSSGCNNVKARRMVPIAVVSSEGARDLTQGSDVDIVVEAPWVNPTASYQRISGGGLSSWRAGLNTDVDKLDDFSQVALAHALRQQPGVRLFFSPPYNNKIRGAYRLSVRSTEYSEDITLDGQKGQAPTSSAGTMIVSALPAMSTSAMAVAGPIGTIVSSFDVITGIPVSGESKETIGLVTVDLSVVDLDSGRVVLSQPVSGQFLSRYRKVGGIMTSGFTEYARSLPAEALESALNVTLPEILKKLRTREGSSAE